jgi:AraC family transcriptional regulator of adaptative response / DNA-3-methyladenine glycosylase II
VAGGPAVLELSVATGGPVTCALRSADALDPADAAAEAVRLGLAVLALDHDAAAADAALAGDPLLADLVRARPGARVPGTADPGEIALRAVLGQQVSVAAARTVAARLSAAHGEPLSEPAGTVTHGFAASAALAELAPEELPMPRARARALIALAAALAGGLDPRDREALLALPGIGPWTADYVAMRCGDPDVLLETDLGVLRGLRRLGHPADPSWLRRHAERWRPWRSTAVVHLWSAA